MKKLFGSLLVAMFIAIPTQSKAQAVDQPLHWSINAGINVSNYLNTPSIFDASAKMGAFFGVGVEYRLDPSWYLESGLNISLKGSSVKGAFSVLGEDIVTAKAKFNPIYLHIPLHVGYKFHFDNGFNLNLSAGPYLAYGLGGKGKIYGEKESIFSSSGWDFKRFDAGLGVKAGMDIDIFNVFIGYDYGLVKMEKDILKAKNGNFYAGAAIKF